jgi:hypothetical protein
VFAEVRYAIRGGLYHFRVPIRTLKPAVADPLRILRRVA